MILMIGLRWALNDEQSSEMLPGIIQDLDTSTRVTNLEASRRLGSNMKLSLNARVYHAKGMIQVYMHYAEMTLSA